MPTSEQNRRDFLRMCGEGAAVGAVSALLRPFSWLEELGKIRQRLWVTTFERCITHFPNAGPLETVNYSKNFFPAAFISDVTADTIWNFATLCKRLASEDRAKSPGGKWNRIDFLPALAAAHCLTSVSEAEQETLRQVMGQIVRRSLDEVPPREYSHPLWQNLTPVLIRATVHGDRFRVGIDVVRAAEEVCVRFLSTSEVARPVVACAAWQFLLTYEIALRATETLDVHAEQELKATRATIDRIRSVRSEKGVWLEELARLYESRRIETLPPQADQLVLCGPDFEARDRRLADFFFISRLQFFYYNQLGVRDLAASTKPVLLTPEYVSLATTLDKVVRRTSGYSVNDWPRLAEQVTRLMSRDAAAYAQQIVCGRDEELVEPESQTNRALKTVSLDEGQVIQEARASEHRVDEAIEGIEAFLLPSSAIADRLRHLWRSSFELGRNRVDPESRDDVATLVPQPATATSDPMQETVYDRALDDYQKAADRFVDAGKHVLADLKQQFKSRVVGGFNPEAIAFTVTKHEGRPPSLDDEGTEAHSSTEGEHMAVPSWTRPFVAYRTEELAVLAFTSIKDLDRCLKLLWEDPALKGCPHDSGDGRTLYVPKEAVEVIRQRRIRFVQLEPINPLSVPPNARAALRHERGM